MNYTIYAGQHLIYNKNIVNENGTLPYIVIDPTLSEQCDGFSSLTYKCLRGSPAYDLSEELKTRIKVYADGVLYWQGRIIDVTKNIKNQKRVYVEDLLGMLNDAIFEPYNFQGTVSEFLNSVVDSYNASVSASQRFISVSCDVDEGNIVRSSEGYSTCWSVVKSKLLDMIGGVMWVSYDANEQPILNYSRNPRRTATQEIRFGKNLKNYSVKWSFDEYYTACYPLGHKDETTKEYVTIGEVNDDVNYIINTSAAEVYGIIFAPVDETTWNDVTDPANLYVRAQEWMQNKAARAIEEIDLTGLDLSTLGVDVSSIQWLDAVLVSTNDFEDLFVLKKVTRRLDNLASIEISMGDSRTSLTGSSATQESQTVARIKNIEADYTTTGEAVSIAQEAIQNDTSIIQQAESIIATALEQYVRTNDYNTFKSELETRFSIMAGEISAEFTSTNKSISDLDADTTQQFNTITTFIRLLATEEDEHGTVTQEGGIVLGESKSDIKLKLENDILYFFTGDEQIVTKSNAIAYFDSGKLYVNEVQIRTISIGVASSMMYFSVVGSGDNRCLFLSGRLYDNV